MLMLMSVLLLLFLFEARLQESALWSNETHEQRQDGIQTTSCSSLRVHKLMSDTQHRKKPPLSSQPREPGMDERRRRLRNKRVFGYLLFGVAAMKKTLDFIITP